MKINIKKLNIGASENLNKYIEKKINSLEKFLKNINPDSIEIWVEVGKPSQHHRQGAVHYAEANLKLPNQLIRAKAFEDDIYAAIDKVKDELRREITKSKEKKTTQKRRGARSIKKSQALSPLSRFRTKNK